MHDLIDGFYFNKLQSTNDNHGCMVDHIHLVRDIGTHGSPPNRVPEVPVK
jgi:hypothetical protein